MVKKKEELDGVWRTIGGRRVFIRKGQDLSSAMKESGKFKTSLEGKHINNEQQLSDKDDNISNLIEKNRQRDKENWEKGISYSDYSLDKAIEKKTNGKYKSYDEMESRKEYELYKRAKENPDSIDPMTENSTDWEALDKKYSGRYEKERNTYESKVFGTDVTKADEQMKKVFGKDFHFAGEELYSDDPNRFGDKLRKYNNKMNPSKNDALNKVKNNRIVENVKSGDRFYEIGNGQWRSEKDGYDYYIDFNSSNIDNPKYRDVASGRIINTNPRADNYWDYEGNGLKSKYKGTIDYLQKTTNMNNSEILELLKRIDEDKK